MKVKEFAELHGVSTQAVYQRLNKFADKSGKERSDFVSRDTGEITEDGYNALQDMYKLSNKKKGSSQSTLTSLKDQVANLQSEIDLKNKLIASLESRLQDKEKEVEQLNIQVVDLKADKQFLQTMLEGLTRKPKQGFFRRLFAGSAKTEPAEGKKSADSAQSREGKSV